MTNAWALVIFSAISGKQPMNMLENIPSEWECVKFQQSVQRALPNWFTAKCVEVIKKDTK